MTQASVPPGTTAPLPRGLTAGGRGAGWVPVRPVYVALDVDGTLVSGDEVPDADILAAIERLGATGVQVGLATGRMAAAADAILATDVLNGPHVFHNGAVVADGTGTERIVQGLTDPEVAALLDFGRGRDDLTIEVYVGRSYLADRTDPRSDAHARLLRAAPEGRIGSVDDLAGRAAIKAVAVCFSAEAAAATIATVTGLGMAAGPAASPATPQLRFVNVTRAGVDKGSGIAAAAALIGADLAAVAAIGDETNDIPMFARVGTAIVMGDAHAPVREHAHLVAPTFDTAGTVVALEALIALARA